MEKFSSFSCTCIGASHYMRKLICQDYSFELNTENFVFAATADGHGSLQYLRTDKGSEFAVKAAFECVEEFIESIDGAESILDDDDKRYDLLEQLWFNIVDRWNELISEDFKEHPFTEEELERIPENAAFYRDIYSSGDFVDAYGTTLAFAVVTKKFALCMQIGDGTVVTITPYGFAAEPVPVDERCQGNVTTSLCQPEAKELARYVFFAEEDIPAAIFLGTDGIENSYGDHSELRMFYRELALIFESEGLDYGFDQLTTFLPQLSRFGSGDDVSCAGIYAPEMLAQCKSAIRSEQLDGEAVTARLNSEMLAEDFYQTDDIEHNDEVVYKGENDDFPEEFDEYDSEGTDDND